MRRAVVGSVVAHAVVGVLLAGGCGPSASEGGADGSGSTASTAAPFDLGEPLGFGTPASEARIAMWDIDVKPDGEGLPPGRGTVAEGEAVYRTQCAGCHGLTGVEGPNDRLVGTQPWEDWPVGRAVGNYWPYATTLFDYISRAMPQMTPGTLTADETYAVIAHILNLNGIVPEDGVMNAETLPAVMMPARDRFVVDNREGGPVVR